MNGSWKKTNPTISVRIGFMYWMNPRIVSGRTLAAAEKAIIGTDVKECADAVRIKIKQVGNGKGKHERGF